MAISISIGTVDEALTVEDGIPEFERKHSREDVEARIGERTHLILIAKHDQENGSQPIAYKVGYEESDGVFYSWIGGVLPDFRRMQLAQKLLDAQEAWVKSQGYSEIRVKSMNRFAGMLILLIKNGYQIVGLEPPISEYSPDIESAKILFRKRV